MISESDIDAHVGKRIRARRRLLGQSQTDLAEQSGVRFQQIQKYETGANRVSASRLVLIGRAQGVPAAFYFEGIEAPAETDDEETFIIAREVRSLPPLARQHVLSIAKAAHPPTA